VAGVWLRVQIEIIEVNEVRFHFLNRKTNDLFQIIKILLV